MKNILPLLFLFACATKNPDDLAKVDADIHNFQANVEKMNQDFNKIPADVHNTQWVEQKLGHMFDVDQYMRKNMDLPFQNHYTEVEKKYFWQQFQPIAKSIDAIDRDELKSLLKVYEWINIRRFGEFGDNRAWLIVQHSDDDLHFQKKILHILEKLYPRKETSGQSYAYLFDRVAIAEKRPQRYGTQGSCAGGPGKWEAAPMENPAKVDIWRAGVGLAPMAEYKLMFKDICH